MRPNGTGEVRKILLRAEQKAGPDVELGGAAGVAIERGGEPVVHTRRHGAARELAVAEQRRLVQSGWASPPQLPIDEAELRMAKISPM